LSYDPESKIKEIY